MRRLASTLLFLAAFAGVPSAQACDCGGCPPTQCGTSSSVSPAGGLLFLREYGQRGPLRAIQTGSGRQAFALPPGIVSADGRVYVAATQRAHRFTTVRTYDARTGRVLRSTTYRGGGWSVAGVSADGRYVALLDSFQRRRVAQIKIVGSGGPGADSGVHNVTLRGTYDVDAISNDGRRLFLIQYLRSGYLVRFYDLARASLAARVLTEKGAPMQGLAWDAVASRDGHYVFTLYLRGDGAAEVHTLDLRRGTAVCIDLPRGDAASIQQYALSLSPNGRTLVAANPALGVVATVDVRARRVTHVVHFRTDGYPPAQSELATSSHDGRTVYFTSGPELYAYDVAYGVVRGAYRIGSPITGLAFTGNDRRLLVVRPDGRAVWLAAATGKRVR
jgi:Tol biopolymer transport system component